MQKSEAVIDTVIYQGRPQKWLYRLASIIAENFRVHTYYVSGSPIELCFVGIESNVQIAQIIFEYARGSAGYCARQFLQLPEIRRKYKRKWQLKQDYIEGYLVGLSKTFRNQVVTNGYEIALQVPEIVQWKSNKKAWCLVKIFPMKQRAMKRSTQATLKVFALQKKNG